MRSGIAIAGALGPQLTIGAADKRISWHTDCLPLSEAFNLGESLPALGTADKRVSWHIECVPLPLALNSGGALTSTLSQLGGALTEHAIRGDCIYLAALTGDRF